MTIGWIEIVKNKYGGFVYHQEARAALAKEFDVEVILREAKYFKKYRYLKIPESMIYLFRLKGAKDIWIRGFLSTVSLALDRTKGKNITVIHHQDFSGFPFFARIIFESFQRLFYKNLKKVDAIVTVSEYWKDYFIKRGYKNVYKIYNGFDMSKYTVNEKEVQEFKKKFDLEGKPIVYIGNCQKAKGVIESYEALKDLDVYLVTSGKPKVKIPAINLDLEYRDYLKLLKASSVVVTMSKFLEGWCRTTHEAMLLKTPVVGSGKGGMGELLEGGGQIVCKDFNDLRKNVEYLLDHPEIGERGYNFVKDFTLEKFGYDWRSLLRKVG